MIIEEMQFIVNKAQQQNKTNLYIRSLLKEYLQIYVLNFVYLNPKYNKIFLFTGGTCLRQCFALNRLSEDLDFDLKKPIDPLELKGSLENYFKKEYLYSDLQISILQRGTQLLLKFPVLKSLNLAYGTESDLLYVKIDLSPIISQIYNQITILKNTGNFNYLITSYDLPSLMSSKLVTILTRDRLSGKENIKIVKGRDYFDLLWFLEKKVIPNLSRVNDLLKATYSINQLFEDINQKVMEATTINRQFFKQDLMPFIDNPQILDGYIENYKDNYNNEKKYLVDVR